MTGYLVAAKDADALAAKLAELVTDAELRRRMGQAARQRAVREYDANIVNGLVAAGYERLLADRARQGRNG